MEFIDELEAEPLKPLDVNSVSSIDVVVENWVVRVKVLDPPFGLP